jgi:putative peptidoglycan lipid II flippase
MKNSALRATVVIGASSLATTGLGFLKNILSAYYFGTSGIMDAYLLALVLPDMAMTLARTGAFNFIPLFAAERQRSEEEGWQAAGKMLTYWLLLLLAALAVGFVFTPRLMAVLAPGFASAQRQQTLELARVLLLMAASVGGARTLSIVLQAEKRFLVSGASEAVFQITSTLYLISFCRFGIQAVVWGQVFGGFAQLLTVCIALFVHRHRIRFSLDFRSKPVRKMVRLTLPVYLGETGAKANLLVTRAFPSMLPAGAVSSLQYAFTLAETLPTLLINAFVAGLFPFLAEQFAEKDDRGARGSLGRAMIVTSLVFMPLTVGVALLAQPLVVVLFQRGSFDFHSTQITTSSLRVLAPGIVALALNALLAAAFHARQNTAVPMKAGLARVACNTALCSLFVPTFGLTGVALAATVSLYFKALLLFFFLKDIFLPGEVSRILRTIARVAMAVACMGCAVHAAAQSFFAKTAALTWMGAATQVAALGTLGVASYLVSLRVFCPVEFKANLQLLRQELGLKAASCAPKLEELAGYKVPASAPLGVVDGMWDGELVGYPVAWGVSTATSAWDVRDLPIPAQPDWSVPLLASRAKAGPPDGSSAGTWARWRSWPDALKGDLGLFDALPAAA